METYSTVLFVDQSPVGYSVQKTNSRIELNPAQNPGRTVQPPRLVAENRAGHWEVNGTDNPELIRQVIEDIASKQLLVPAADLSAAP